MCAQCGDFRSRRFLADPFFYAALALGGLGLLLPGGGEAPALWRILLLALAEEAVFRGGVQAWLEQRLRRRGVDAPGGVSRNPRMLGPVSAASVLASVLFALVHLFGHEPLWALGSFFPSLVFGALYTRYERVLPCAIAHAVYNLAYFS